MLKRACRLHRAQDYARLRREGSARRHAILLVSTASNALPKNRYGFIVGKTVGGAVVRNRIKRQLREAVRQLHPEVASGVDVVVIARPPIVGTPFATIEQVIRNCLQQARLLKG